MDFYYIKQGYALVAINDNNTGHWFGGKAYHEGAYCPKCKHPLLLLADIDCTKLRTVETAKLFQNAERLPLYYCWRCEGAEISYTIIDSERIQVLKYDGAYSHSDFPYNDYPLSFPRRPVSLVPIDYSLAKLLAICQEADEFWLSEEDRKLLGDGIGKIRHKYFGKRNINRHQLGGWLKLVQQRPRLGCPNSSCKLHKRFFEDGIVGYSMKELAAIFNDPISGLPMIDPINLSECQQEWDQNTQVVFWICEGCLAITASNFCS
jgi:hypothetical protein